MRDGDKTRYLGKGVTKAIANVNEIIGPVIINANVDCTNQAAVDKLMLELDGTDNKYNQILRIEEELGSAAVYAGKKFRKPLA